MLQFWFHLQPADAFSCSGVRAADTESIVLLTGAGSHVRGLRPLQKYAHTGAGLKC